MTLRTDDAQPAQFTYLFLLFFSFFLIFLMKPIEFFSRLQEFRIFGLYKSGGKGDGFSVISQFFHFLSRFKFRVSAQDDVRTTACHIGRDGNRSETSGFGDNLRLLLMMLSVKDIKLFNPPLFQSVSDNLRLLNGNRTDQNRLSGFMGRDYLVHNRFIFAFFRAVYRVLQILSDDRQICRHYYNVHVVDIAELVFLCLSCTGHPRQLLVHAEVVLQGNRRQGS